MPRDRGLRVPVTPEALSELEWAMRRDTLTLSQHNVRAIRMYVTSLGWRPDTPSDPEVESIWREVTALVSEADAALQGVERYVPAIPEDVRAAVVRVRLTCIRLERVQQLVTARVKETRTGKEAAQQVFRTNGCDPALKPALEAAERRVVAWATLRGQLVSEMKRLTEISTHLDRIDGVMRDELHEASRRAPEIDRSLITPVDLSKIGTPTGRR